MILSQPTAVGQLAADYLSSRRISQAVAKANSVRPQRLDSGVPCIAFPYHHPHTGEVLLTRYRLLGDSSRWPRDPEGKPIKCIAPKGSANHLYVVQSSEDTLDTVSAKCHDTSIPILIIEGEGKALAMQSYLEETHKQGLVIGISGCWNWQKARTPLPDFEWFSWNRTVTIVCDSNVTSNGSVHAAITNLAKHLQSLGSKVSLANTPDGYSGMDDFYSANGAESVDKIISNPLLLSDWIAKTEATLRGDKPSASGKDKESLPEKLIRIALENGSLWHDSAGNGWVDFTVNNVTQTARIRSKRFKDFLARQLWETERKAPSTEGVSQALTVLEGIARYDSVERQAYLRVGKLGDTIYVDLGREDWQVIKVSSEGWEVIPYDACPIRFYRSECQLPLPLPTPNSDIDALWQLVRCTESDRPLLLAWLLSCLIPDGSKPILVLTGEKGSGKSSTASTLKKLLDPTQADRVTSVGNSRQLATMANSRWVLLWDNLSSLSVQQQDLLCCVSTGAGFSHRTLYTDLDETFLSYRRPQILTSIDLVPTRSDLLERCLLVRLERIPEGERVTEAELEARLAALLPGVLGSLLSLLSNALKRLPTIKCSRLPRLADFAHLAIAAGVPRFSEAYDSSIESGNRAAVEADPVAAAIAQLLDSAGGYWQGTASEMVRKLQEQDSGRELQQLSARSLGKRLAGQLRSDLRAVGITVEDQRTGQKRMLTLTYSPQAKKETSQTSLTSQPAQGADSSSDVFAGETSLPPEKTSLPEEETSSSEDELELERDVFPPSSDVSDAPAPITSHLKPAPEAKRDISDVSDVFLEELGGEDGEQSQLQLPLQCHEGIPPWEYEL